MNDPIKYEDVKLLYNGSDLGKQFTRICAMLEGYHARHAMPTILYAWKFLTEHPDFIPENIYIE